MRICIDSVVQRLDRDPEARSDINDDLRVAMQEIESQEHDDRCHGKIVGVPIREDETITTEPLRVFRVSPQEPDRATYVSGWNAIIARDEVARTG